jgi:hypothetical protein
VRGNPALELGNPSLKGSAGYVLSRLRWTAKELGRTLRPDLIALIETHPSGNLSALTEALARGRYTTGSEEELADRTRTDIRLHNS